jgi:hypothetical protein
MSHVPNIKTNPSGWFAYFDRDGQGTLDKREVCDALIETFPKIERGSIVEIIDMLWPSWLICIFMIVM